MKSNETSKNGSPKWKKGNFMIVSTFVPSFHDEQGYKIKPYWMPAAIIVRSQFSFLEWRKCMYKCNWWKWKEFLRFGRLTKGFAQGLILISTRKFKTQAWKLSFEPETKTKTLSQNLLSKPPFVTLPLSMASKSMHSSTLQKLIFRKKLGEWAFKISAKCVLCSSL